METSQPEEQKSVLQKIKEFITTSLNSRTVGILALLILFAAIPLTVYVSQQQQETRQRAQESAFRQQAQPKPTKKIDEEKDACKGKSKPGGCECKKDKDCTSNECKRAEGQKEGKCTGPTPTPSPTPPADCKKSTDRPNGCPCENNNQCNSKVCDEPPDKGDSDEEDEKKEEEKRDEEEKDAESQTASAKKKDKVCIGPTLTVSPTPPSTSSGELKLAVVFALWGIGPSENNNPKHPQRDVTISIFDENNVEVVSKTTQVKYDSQFGIFTGIINLGRVPPGTYSVKTHTPGYLRKLVVRIFRVFQDGTFSPLLSQATTAITPGDITNDNKLDITDYNILISCFGEKASSQGCGTNNELSDLNDDGAIDGVDYNLFLRALAVREGD